MPDNVPDAPWWVVVSWLVTVVGWVIVDKRSSKQASASETFQIVREVENLLQQFRSDVIESLLLGGQDADASRLRRSAIEGTNRIQVKLKLLRQRDARFDVGAKYLRLKKIATGNDFESIDRSPLILDDLRINKITAQADDIITSIHKVYNNIYGRSKL